jgi:hypothetical protein
MSRPGGIVWGLCVLPPGIAVGFTFAAGVNLYYDFHPFFFFGTLLALALTWFFGRASLLAFGVGPRIALVAPPVLALVWMGAFFAVCWNSYPDRAAAAHKHELVLRSTPVYPGLTFRDESTWGRYGDDVGEEGFVNPPRELLTSWTWLAPSGVLTRDVAAWYDERLRAIGWDVQRDDVGEGSIDLVGSRLGSADIELDVLPLRQVLVLNGENPTHADRVVATVGP